LKNFLCIVTYDAQKLQQLLYSWLIKFFLYMQYFEFTVRITFSKHVYVGVQNSSRITLLLKEIGLGFNLYCVLNTSNYYTRIFFFVLQYFRDTHTHTHTHHYTLPNPHSYMSACLSVLFHHPPAHSSVIPSIQRA
jgi:hypothetical protein